MGQARLRLLCPKLPHLLHCVRLRLRLRRCAGEAAGAGAGAGEGTGEGEAVGLSVSSAFWACSSMSGCKHLRLLCPILPQALQRCTRCTAEAGGAAAGGAAGGEASSATLEIMSESSALSRRVVFKIFVDRFGRDYHHLAQEHALNTATTPSRRSVEPISRYLIKRVLVSHEAFLSRSENVTTIIVFSVMS